MNKPLEYCLNSQAVAAEAEHESDLDQKQRLIEDAKLWLDLAEVELWLEDHRDQR